MTTHYCEFETAGGSKIEYPENMIAPDGTRIREVHGTNWIICGQPAKFKYESERWWMWVCAEHWDFIHDDQDGSFKVPEATFGRGRARTEADEESAQCNCLPPAKKVGE